MTKFQHGASGNPEGRPKGSVSITSAIKRKLEETNPASKRLYVDDLVDVMIEMAVKGKDFRAIKEIWNHIDGSPRQTTEMVGSIPFLSISREAEERYGEKRRQADELVKQYLERTHGE